MVQNIKTGIPLGLSKVCHKKSQNEQDNWTLATLASIKIIVTKEKLTISAPKIETEIRP